MFQFLTTGFSQLPNGVDVDVVVPLALKARENLLATLAELDDEFADEYLLLDNPERILPSDVVRECVKRVSVNF